MYVFSGNDDNDKEIDSIERHNLQPGTPFVNVQIKNQQLLLGKNFLTIYMQTSKKFFIFGKDSTKILKFEIELNIIEESEMKLELQDEFANHHSAILYSNNFIYLIGDTHCH